MTNKIKSDTVLTVGPDQLTRLNSYITAKSGSDCCYLKKKTLGISVESLQVSAQRCLYAIHYGVIVASNDKMYTTCGFRTCMNPAHLAKIAGKAIRAKYTLVPASPTDKMVSEIEANLFESFAGIEHRMAGAFSEMQEKLDGYGALIGTLQETTEKLGEGMTALVATVGRANRRMEHLAAGQKRIYDRSSLLLAFIESGAISDPKIEKPNGAAKSPAAKRPQEATPEKEPDLVPDALVTCFVEHTGKPVKGEEHYLARVFDLAVTRTGNPKAGYELFMSWLRSFSQLDRQNQGPSGLYRSCLSGELDS